MSGKWKASKEGKGEKKGIEKRNARGKKWKTSKGGKEETGEGEKKGRERK